MEFQRFHVDNVYDLEGCVDVHHKACGVATADLDCCVKDVQEYITSTKS